VPRPLDVGEGKQEAESLMDLEKKITKKLTKKTQKTRNPRETENGYKSMILFYSIPVGVFALIGETVMPREEGFIGRLLCFAGPQLLK